MLEKMKYMENNYDWMRTMTMCEPIGHRKMVGAVLTEPTTPELILVCFTLIPADMRQCVVLAPWQWGRL